jgi:hypothetical protein
MPDYNADLIHVYQQATYASITANQSLAILSLISSRDEEESQFASWVVDFDKYFSSLPKSNAVNIHFGSMTGSIADAASDDASGDSAGQSEVEDEAGTDDDEAGVDVEGAEDDDLEENDESVEEDVDEEDDGMEEDDEEDNQIVGAEGGMFALLNDLDFALAPFNTQNRSWYPPDSSEISVATLDAASGNLQLHGLKFDTIHQTTPFTVLESLAFNTADDSSAAENSDLIAAHICKQDIFLPSLYQPTTGVPEEFRSWLYSYLNASPEDPKTDVAHSLTWVEYHIATGCYFPDLSVSQHGFVGLCGPGARFGDVIALLHGAPAPALLRAKEDGTWCFRGWTYVHGIMGDELAGIIQDSKSRESTFVLS